MEAGVPDQPGRGGTATRSMINRAAASVALGDHVCWCYDDDQARSRAVTAYVAAGVRQHHKILYFTDSVAVPDVLSGLERSGIPTTAWESGQVEVLTAAETYLASGRFDAEASIEGWSQESARARAAGYRGLRAIGDMAWVGRGVPGVERLPSYEAAVSRVFAEGFAAAICLYDVRTIDADLHREVTAAHPATFDPPDAAAGPWSPMLRMARLREPAGLRLSGEIDVSNRRAVLALLERVCAETPAGEPVTVDVSGLRFADAATARRLGSVSATRVGGLRLVGASPLVTRLIATAPAPGGTVGERA